MAVFQIEITVVTGDKYAWKIDAVDMPTVLAMIRHQENNQQFSYHYAQEGYFYYINPDQVVSLRINEEGKVTGYAAAKASATPRHFRPM